MWFGKEEWAWPKIFARFARALHLHVPDYLESRGYGPVKIILLYTQLVWAIEKDVVIGQLIDHLCSWLTGQASGG